ncbi:Histone acetyltransferase HPA2 and related acetyltransferases [hydrothermal vent metagenome]|uniref:Histone acetyltransferase HPA2 and related acetyltransferases n=1 Tax=hydrothermal vent metagenome TaxID=652676 RepID=A0A1W1EJB2_9ZZZZ
MSKFEISLFMGKSILENQKDIVDLRIEILENSPYTYKIQKEDEQEYIKKFAKIKDSIIVTLKDNNKIVAMLNAIPLIYENQEILLVWSKTEFEVNSIYYFKEILISHQYNRIELKQEILNTAQDWIKGFNKYNFFITSITNVDENSTIKEQFYRDNLYDKLDIKANSRYIRREDNQNNKLHFWIKKI